ncbi:DUF5681 domain-containing protein [Mesorhizobium sp. 10J20-29]
MSDQSDDDPSTNDKIGYRKPPNHTRFKKGQSGNPKGRKPRVTNASTLLQIELDKLIVVRDGNKERQITKREAFMTSLVNDAINNKPRARSDLLKLLDVAPPPEPFVATEEDESVLDEFLERVRRRQKSGGGEDDEGVPPDDQSE